jgi:histidinol dehydrogenase
MKIIDCRKPEAAAELEKLYERTAFPEDIERSVAELLSNIRANGDAAIAEYAEKFDGVKLTPEQFRVSDEEIAQAANEVDPVMAEAIQLAYTNIMAFTKQRIPKDWSFSPREGVTLGERFVPLDRIAAYIPGGTAPLVSTTLHTITMAAAVGVKDIVVITPPGPDGKVNPAILHAAKVAGATEIYRLGGVYGVGAVAYGTPTVPKVQKIVGPGNAYVTAAKRQVYGYVALDMVAGPSEILVIADDTARADFIAADMLSQMEHGSGHEQAVLVTTSDRLIDELPTEILRQADERERQETIFTVMEKGAFVIRVSDMGEAAKVASDYAPEHLEIMTADADDVAKKITCAGATFIGQWTPEPVGDFTAGPSHVLPTGGAARFFSGLTVDQFVRRISQVKYDQAALQREAAALAAFGGTEELDAHARSVSIRLEK